MFAMTLIAKIVLLLVWKPEEQTCANIVEVSDCTVGLLLSGEVRPRAELLKSIIVTSYT